MTIITLKDNIPDKFSITTYPDGQRNLTLSLKELNIKKPIQINCSIKNFSDLELFICLVSALRKNDFYVKKVYFAYLFGMRSDRSFEKGQSNYFRDVVAPIINGLSFDYIEILEAHNDIVGSYINKCNLIKLPMPWKSFEGYGMGLFDVVLIGGDESFQMPDVFQGSNFVKKRNGNEMIVLLPYEIKDTKKTIIIMDDLCDAGGTFIAEAKYLREKGIHSKLWLYVTHGLFTKGLQPLLEYFDKIICTNSYQDISHPRVHQIKVI